MLDEKNIRVMTKLASYEEGVGKKYMAIGNYFRTDYITLQLLKSFVCGTIAFLAVGGIMLFCNFEMLMGEAYETDLVEFAKGLGKKYLILIGLYLLATYIWSAWKYTKAKKSLNSYKDVLNKLEQRLNQQ